MFHHVQRDGLGYEEQRPVEVQITIVVRLCVLQEGLWNEVAGCVDQVFDVPILSGDAIDQRSQRSRVVQVGADGFNIATAAVVQLVLAQEPDESRSVMDPQYSCATTRYSLLHRARRFESRS